MDLNVLPCCGNIGIGSLLLDHAEPAAVTTVVGISVGLYAGQDGAYAAAQRLYVQRG